MKAMNPQLVNKNAATIFTDREAPRAAFWHIYNNMEPGDIEIINYYGIGGIGKTSLLKQLQIELEEHGNKKYVEYSFENRKPKDLALFDLSRQLMKKWNGLKFSLFDYAFEKYKILSGDEFLGKQMVEKENILDHHLVGSAVNAVGDFVPFVNAVSSAVTEGTKAVIKLKQKYEELKGVNAEIYQEISSIDTPIGLFNSLQYYFAIDAYAYFKDYEGKEPLVVMLDGYEVFVNRLEKGEKANGDDLWLREEGSLITSIPNAIWVIAGREKLSWDEEMLPQDHTHIIGNLSDSDALDFFHKSGIQDEALARALYKLTDGTPVYMDLCVRQYKNYVARNDGKVPGAEIFGKDTEEITVRFLRDMTIMEQGILYLLSCMPNTWSDELVFELVKKLDYEFSKNEFMLIKDMTLVEALDPDGKMHRLHETFRKVIFDQMKEDEKKLILNALKDIFVEKIKDKNEKNMIDYHVTSYLELCKNSYDLLNLSVKDHDIIGWCIFRVYTLNRTNDENFEFMKYKLLASKEEDWTKKYTNLVRRQIKAYEYYDRDKDAIKAASNMYDLFYKDCVSEAVPEEDQAWASCLYGVALFNENNYKESIANLKEVIDLYQSGTDLAFVCIKQALDFYGWVIRNYEEDYEGYEWCQRKIIEVCDKELEKLNSEDKIKESIKLYQYRVEDKAKALRRCDLHEEALQLLIANSHYIEKYSDSIDDKCSFKMEIANAYFGMHQYEKNIEVLNEVLDIYKNNDYEEDDYIYVYSELRNGYYDLHDFEEAAKWGEKVLALTEKYYGENSLSAADDAKELADALLYSYRYDEAEELYKKAIDIYTSFWGKEHSTTCGAKEYLATLYRNSSKPEKACEILGELHTIYKGIFGENHGKTLNAWFRYLNKYILEEDYETGRKLGEEAFPKFVTKGEEYLYDIIEAIRYMARVCGLLDDYSASIDYMKKAYELLLNQKYVDYDFLYQLYDQSHYYYNMAEDYDNLFTLINTIFDLLKNHPDEFSEDEYQNERKELGCYYRETGDLEKAISIHLEVYDYYKAIDDKESLLDAGLALSIDYDYAKQYEDALKIDQENYKLACEVFGEDSEDALEYKSYIEEDYEKLGQE